MIVYIDHAFRERKAAGLIRNLTTSSPRTWRGP